ncbi:MAG: dockerin type I domain-containing protein [Oscillospiraceae bacterium]|jgi:hypothetical protein|nr:dockerin type I domain-containing protein [Oscillospiraceae bacterium]
MKTHAYKRILAVLLAMVMSVAVMSGAVFASPTAAGYVYISADANTLGAGYLYEPTKVPFYEGDSWAAVTIRYLGESNLTHWGDGESGFYMSYLRVTHDFTVNIPDVLLPHADAYTDSFVTGQMLGEFDIGFASGWMYTVNTVFPNGASDEYPEDGDVCRWQFTVAGLGGDLGGSGFGSEPLFPVADKDALTAAVAEINSAPNKAELLAKSGVQDAYDAAITALTDLGIAQELVDAALAALENALDEPTTVLADSDYTPKLNASLAYLVQSVPTPGFGTGGGEWTILSLARAGYAVPTGYYDGYLTVIGNLFDNLAETTNVGYRVNAVNGKREVKLDSNKSTENERLILALSSLGVDSTNFVTATATYDLVARLADYTWDIRQGINGPIFALIALNTNGYTIPTDSTVANQATEDNLIQYILDKEIKKGTDDAGGWALSGTTPDPDMTAMAIQALAPYNDNAHPLVAAAIDRAVGRLSDIQRPDGGYASWGTVNAESIAQTILALTAVGIDPVADPRFIKVDANGISNNPISALLTFAVAGGGFSHTLGSGQTEAGGAIAGAVNNMATDQATYALVAYDRFLDEKTALYDMADAFATTTRITAGTAAATIGTDATATVEVSIADNAGFRAFSLVIGYDTTALELTGVSWDSALPSGPQSTAGALPIVQYTKLSKGNFTGNGRLFTLTFTLKAGATAGEYPVTVSLNEAAVIPARPFHNDAAEPVPVSFAAGAVTLNAATEAQIIVGDISGDGEISQDDVILLQELILRGNLTQEEFARADLNHDGKVNLVDVALLKKMIKELGA